MRHKNKKRNALLWVFEALEGDERFLQKKFFSFEAAYVDGRLCLAVSDGKEPWAGLLVCTQKEQHAVLRGEFPELKAHRVLGKWLYISQTHREFERVARDLVELVLRRDQRIGVVSNSRKVLEEKQRSVAKDGGEKVKKAKRFFPER